MPVERDGLTPADVVLLGEQEALQRLELLALTSQILDSALDDYEQALKQVADACVPAFADLCALEVIGAGGEVVTAAYRYVGSSGLNLPANWNPVGRLCTPNHRPVLAFEQAYEAPNTRLVRERLGAQSLIVAPITGGGVTLGWLVAATGCYRRGFRPSAFRSALELASRIGTAIQRVHLHREMQASAREREQVRTLKRLRRLAGAATNLAGAATTRAVLEVACVQACVIQEADGAIARWWMRDGSVVTAHAGKVDPVLAEAAFEGIADTWPTRGKGWVAYPLRGSDPSQKAALVVFVAEEISEDEELVLSSLASLVPVAFERALGTEATILHEARLRAVVESSPVALISLREDGTVHSANPAARRLFSWGIDPGSWRLAPRLRGAMIDLADAVKATSGVVTRTVSVEGQDLSISGAPLPAASAADEDAVLIAGIDLSDIRKAERALVEAQRLEAMGQVAGRVAHDFNNLLTLILGYTDLLRRSSDGEQRAALLDSIEGASRRAAALTRQLLGMTRHQADSSVVIDLAEELCGLQAVLGRVAGPNVRVEMHHPEREIKVRLDPSETEQIVVNLVMNACDALDGAGKIVISLGTENPGWAKRSELELPEGRLAVLTVADDGPGMSEEVRARCLEPFFTTKQRGQGTGLGLSTVYRLVKDRGGQLRVDSEPGTGTTVTIWLPVEEDAERGPSRGSASEEDDTWPEGLTLSGRVLLVEDDAELLEVAQEALSSVGLEVVGVADAEDALTKLAGYQPFDLLLTDIRLPGMSGLELADRARAAHRGMPVLYMTAFPDADIPVGAGKGVLRKPYRPNQLRLRVAEALDGRALQGSKR